MTLSIEESVVANSHALYRPVGELLSKFSSSSIGALTVRDVLKRGLRNVPSLVSDVSSVDPNVGQKIRGVPIRDYMKSNSMYSAFWYSMSGRHGTKEEIKKLKEELFLLRKLSPQTIELVRSMVATLPHATPVALLSSIFMLISDNESGFLEAQSAHASKNEMIKAAVLDSKKIFAQSISLIGLIYSAKYGDNTCKSLPFSDESWGESFAHLLGLNKEHGKQLEKIGMVHMAQGKGNVSSQVSHLVSTMGGDPYKCISACIIALSAPYHAKASQDVMFFIDEIIDVYGDDPTEQQVKEFLILSINKRKKLPGIGQAVMKNPDPRFLELNENAGDSRKIGIIRKIFQMAGAAFEESGIILNSPNPNVNLILGSYAETLGIKERDMFPLLFIAGRVMDPLSQFVENIIWDTSMQRPASLTTSEVFHLVTANNQQNGGYSSNAMGYHPS